MIMKFFFDLFKRARTPKMEPVQTSPKLSLYERMYIAASTKPEFSDAVDWTRNLAMRHKDRYLAVSAETGVPWEVIAVIHNLECAGNFNKHLHNGDPLSRRTTSVPSGRPMKWDPPGTWEESASDALRYDNLHRVDWSSLDRALYAIERYNGLGYRTRGVASPYLWSGTQFHTSGKFVRDGVYDANAVSNQVGAVPLLKALGWRV
jgi:lysozyme family protein